MGEPVTLARKILSAVARVGQRFGASHVANVLRGSGSEAVSTRGHDQLSVFGLLRDAPVDEVRGYIDQFVAEGFLLQTDDQFPVLKLTQQGVDLMRDAAAAPGLSLARQRKPEKGKPAKRAGVEAASWEGVDRDLFEELRAMRLRLARERGSAAVRHLSRHHAARARAGQARDARRAEAHLWHRRTQGR